MNEKRPLISIVIPTFKRPNTLKRAIDSVLSQTYSNIEIIVVDDNNDGDAFRIETEQLINDSYQNERRLIYLKHHKNKNGSAARNTGFRNSNGDFIMFLDDDDEFLPTKIEDQLRVLLEKGPDWGACYSAYIRKENGKVKVKSKEKVEGNLLVEELARNLFVHAGSNLMIRRSAFEEIDGFDESFKRNQDVEMLCRLLQKYKLAYSKNRGLVVNIHHDNATVNFIDLTDQYLNKFASQIDALPNDAQNKVYKMIGLQIFRYYLFSKRMKPARDTLKKYKISFACTIKYVLYLAVRGITKKSYGFDMNKIK